MLHYKTDLRALKKKELKNLWFFVPFYGLLPAIDFLFKTDLVWDSYYFVVGALSLASLVDLYSKRRLHQLVFDTQRAEIIIETNTFENLLKRQTLPFRETNLQVSRPVTIFQLKETPLTLTFYHRRKEVLKINNHKDGLPPETLEEIREKVLAYCSPNLAN
ncbi:hypothetical protein [Rufibacter hautae]|uniref:Uncharacterized protein n=1 Tax=Rufibacter hautae TaxID=2595005 RepID=A0A5B6THQ5_9BACT|nr:hypothetical protein [Rufibacter hautae]KAA3439526.1 hypothetical protein FOA19_02230 [Rufibacter hautae]